jgi:hypothetical protein
MVQRSGTGSMATKTFYRERAKVGSLTRSRQSNDPELLAAGALMAEESLVDAINKALAKAPPLTPAVHERILGLLS